MLSFLIFKEIIAVDFLASVGSTTSSYLVLKECEMILLESFEVVMKTPNIE